MTSFVSPPSLCHSPVNDTLDDIFDESGDEEESQGIVNQVLDEIGIEISGKVRKMFYFLLLSVIIIQVNIREEKGNIEIQT